MDVEIDISANESDKFTVENDVLNLIVAKNCGFQVSMTWEQAKSLYEEIKGYFDES